ncbi:DnaJsubfamily C member 3 [Hordeum vulgare]|nr:DnaJsubfamily C member 3 [Hordeum vulgare]
MPPELRAVEAQLTALTNDVAQTISDRFSFCFSNTEVKLNFLQKIGKDMAIREALMKAERQLKLSKRKDWYKILGISKTTSATDIKRAYKRLALQWHPDKNVENHEEAENMF